MPCCRSSPFSSKVQGPEAQSAIGPDEAKLIRRLVTRLRDSDHLDEFELIYRSGRVKMDGGLDLVFPEEMKLLERLAGLEGGLGNIDGAYRDKHSIAY